MKRIAILYSVNFGRNDGAPLYYCEALKRLKDMEVVHLTPDKTADDFGDFDYTFWVDWGEDGLPWKRWYPEGSKWGKKIYVASDTHITDEGRKYRFETALKFDYVFWNQKRAMTEFAEWIVQNRTDGSTLKEWHWLPHAVEPLAYPHFEIIKKYDVCFIGHLQNVENINGFSRIDALDRLFAGFSNFYYGSRSPIKAGVNMFEDAARKFCMSKIVFNVSIKDDINMRVFETLATGSFLLTNKLPTLPRLFEDGKHLVMYETLDDMIEKARYYIEHDEKREEIALAGQKEVLDYHTYSHRIDRIFDIINK